MILYTQKINCIRNLISRTAMRHIIEFNNYIENDFSNIYLMLLAVYLNKLKLNNFHWWDNSDIKISFLFNCCTYNFEEFNFFVNHSSRDDIKHILNIIHTLCNDKEYVI